MLLEKSYANLLHNMDIDFNGTKTTIIGGRINTDKLVMLESLIDQMDYIFLGGELATTFNKFIYSIDDFQKLYITNMPEDKIN